jgi:purine-binding chemotaxis protein CheW
MALRCPGDSAALQDCVTSKERRFAMTDDSIVVFTIDECRLALPLTALQRIVRMVEITPLPGAPPDVLGVIDVAGRVMPVVCLRRHCRLPPREPGLNSVLLIARTARTEAAIVADEVLGVRQVAAGQMMPAGSIGAASLPIAGVCQSDEGPLPIPDLDRLLAEVEHLARGQGS